MKLFDSHSHVSFKAYKEDADEVIKRSFDHEVVMMTVGTQQDTSKQAIELAEKYETGIWASVGLHPTHAIAHGFNDEQELDFKPRQEIFDPVYYQGLVDSSKKVKAVGECGLDYYRLPKENAEEMKKQQYDAFMAQAAFAAQNKLPLIIHCRDAYIDQRAALDEAMQKWGKLEGVMHCFTGTYEEAKLFLDIGFYISFSGIVTFAKPVQETAKNVPLDRMLIETDAPYLTPPPFRGKRNEPLYVQYIANHLAEIKNVPVEEVAEITYDNASKLFKI
jgi:TatD DNase family protein